MHWKASPTHFALRKIRREGRLLGKFLEITALESRRILPSPPSYFFPEDRPGGFLTWCIISRIDKSLKYRRKRDESLLLAIKLEEEAYRGNIVENNYRRSDAPSPSFAENFHRWRISGEKWWNDDNRHSIPSLSLSLPRVRLFCVGHIRQSPR